MDQKATTHERIKVFVNGKQLSISPTFSVRHAILAYDEDTLADIVAGEAYVVDARENEVGLDGALFDGMRLYVKGTEAE